MNKISIKIGIIALTLILGIFTWQSCSSDLDNNFNNLNSENISWKEQLVKLERVKENIYKKYGYELVETEYLYKIQEQEQVVNTIQLLTDKDICLPMYGKSFTDIIPMRLVDMNNVETSIIKSSNEVVTFYQSKDNYIKNVNKFVKKGQEIIKLTWKKNNIIFPSYAIAQEGKGFIFDTFSYGLISIENANVNPMRVKRNNLENGSNQNSDRVLSYSGGIHRVVTKSYFFGIISIENGEVDIKYSIKGKVKDGVKAVTEESSSAHVDAEKGKIDAEIKCIEFVKGKGGYARYSYAYYITSSGSNIAITAMGNSFSLSGTAEGGCSGSGTATLSAESLE